MNRRNSFNLIRLMAALSVFLSHSFFLAGQGAKEPLYRLSRGQTALGTVAVMVFFAISGYLITESFVRSQSSVRFVIDRALRIYPALIVVVSVLAFGLGPLLTTLPIDGYFAAMKPARYVAGNLLFLGVDSLPGVFHNLPFPNSVDGSLWTLYYEVTCYGVVLALGIIGLLRWQIALSVAALCVAGQIFGFLGVYALLGLPFATGSVIRLSRMPLRTSVASLCLVGCAASLLLGEFSLVAGTLGAYAIITLGASASGAPDPTASIGDLSYGVYVWGAPMEQVSASLLGPAVSWWGVASMSVLPTLALAWLSWRCVERPCLRLKRLHFVVPGKMDNELVHNNREFLQ